MASCLDAFTSEVPETPPHQAHPQPVPEEQGNEYTNCEHCNKSIDEHTIISVVTIGDIVSYTIPTFPFISVKLQHMKYQLGSDQTVYDGYLGAEGSSLDIVSNGSVLKVCYGYENAFLVPQKEFDQSIDTTGMILLDNSAVFVIWKWEVLPFDESDTMQSMSSTDKEPEGRLGDKLQDGETVDDELEDERMSVIHALTFKCIGTTKEERYQEILAEASLHMREGKTVNVRLTPEPRNPYNSMALAFECETSKDKWERIGYMVDEVLSDVHMEMKKGTIVSVEAQWIRYITHWSRSVPAWYCGIKISKKGPWSKICLRSRSTL